MTFAGDGTTAEKIKTQQELTMNAWVDQQMGQDKPNGDQEDEGPKDHRAELFDVKEEAFKEVSSRTRSIPHSLAHTLQTCPLTPRSVSGPLWFLRHSLFSCRV